MIFNHNNDDQSWTLKWIEAVRNDDDDGDHIQVLHFCIVPAS